MFDEDEKDIDIEVEDYGPFNGIFGTSKNVELLQLLLSMPDLQLNMSQLSRVLGISYKTVSKIIKHIEKFNVIQNLQEGKGREKVYQLNFSSPIVQLLEKINLEINFIEEPYMSKLIQRENENINIEPYLNIFAFSTQIPYQKNLPETSSTIIIIESNIEQTNREKTHFSDIYGTSLPDHITLMGNANE